MVGGWLVVVMGAARHVLDKQQRQRIGHQSSRAYMIRSKGRDVFFFAGLSSRLQNEIIGRRGIESQKGTDELEGQAANGGEVGGERRGEEGRRAKGKEEQERRECGCGCGGGGTVVLRSVWCGRMALSGVATPSSLFLLA